MKINDMIPANEDFRAFVLINKRNRKMLMLVLIAILIQITIFKYLYPFASYIHGDSFSYISAAASNVKISTYMIGYSKFLRLFSVFSTSDLTITIFQYLFIQASIIFLDFTIFYFLKPTKLVETLLLTLTVLNPLFLHLSNLISSDGLFFAFSILWITTMIWIIFKPSKAIFIIHIISLYLAFITRYNALIYPVLSLLGIAMTKTKIWHKAFWTVISLVLCCTFVIYTSYQYKLLTGTWQYSPFSGWQWANNAMYAYRYVDSSKRKAVPKEFHRLDNMIRKYFDSTRNTSIHPEEKIQASTFYMWSYNMPLMKYRDMIAFEKDTSAKEFKKWASMGPLYNRYGRYIIKTYPKEYFRYFIVPNFFKYYAPPVEFLQYYNSEKKNVATNAAKWFNYKTLEVHTRMKNNKVWILGFLPILSGVTNVLVLFTLICYILLKGWKSNRAFKIIIILFTTLWITNAAFTILASSVALRFQSFPIFISTTLIVLLIPWITKYIEAKERLNLELIKNKKNCENADTILLKSNELI